METNMFHIPAHKNVQAPAGQFTPGLAELHAKCDAQNPQEPQPDFAVANHGSVFLLTPKTAEARDWCEQNLPDNAPVWAGSYAVEHRYIENIIHGITGDGLAVAA
jgi:hypothetical protein